MSAFLSVWSDGNRKRNCWCRQHFFFLFTCVRNFCFVLLFVGSSVSVCLYIISARSCRFFFSLCSLARGINQKKKVERATFWFPPTSWCLFFFIYLFFRCLISNRKCVHLSPGLEKVEETNHSRVHECGASEGIGLVLLLTHHQDCFPNFLFFYFFYVWREKETLEEIT